MNPTTTGPRFRAYATALEALRLTGALLGPIRTADRSLADQLKRAATSVALNLAEGGKRRHGDRAHFYRIAAGSAAESRACLDVAAALGYLDSEATARAWRAFDDVAAMLYPLTR
jgi:four helix bundle protein